MIKLFSGNATCKRVLHGLMFFSLLALSSCNEEYDDTWVKETTEDLKDRVAALEEWQKSVNTSITTLQDLIAALEDKDYVTGVTPLEDGTGYVITFLKSGSITIKHGEKGETGDKGDKGDTPAISVKQDVDGKYYWTLDGEWLLDGGNKMPVTGEKGDKGDQGDKGETGDKGDTGAAAVAPQLQINADTNEWEISTDGGATWTSTGVKATGDKGEPGIQGSVGPSGAACGISDVTIDGTNVIFTLGTGPDAQQFSVPLSSSVLTFNALDEITQDDNIFVTESNLFGRTDLVIQTSVESRSAGGTDIINTRSSAGRWKVDTEVRANKLNIAVEPAKETPLNEVALLKVTVSSEDGQQLAYGQKVFTNGIFMGRLVVTSFDDLMEQLQKADKTKATDIRISGSFEDNIEYGEMEALMASLNDFREIGTLEIAVPEITVLSYQAFEERTNIKVFKSDYINVFDGDGLFWNSSVEEVYLPNLEILGQTDFSSCKNLRKVNLENVVEVKGSQVFSDCSSLEILDLPNLTTFENINKANFALRCLQLKAVNMPKVTSLPNNAFTECYSLTHLNFPEVTELGSGVFLNCTNLSSISLPKVKVLGKNTFKGCISLRAEEGFENIEEVGESAFSGCSAITQALLREVTTIGKSAFAGCRSLSVLALGAVESVANSAFDGVDTESCTLTFNGTPTAGDLDISKKEWCGKKWKSIRVI